MNIVPGNMFENGFDLMMVTVNCDGVSRKGNALEFKRRFPDAERQYRIMCQYGRIRPGGFYRIAHTPIILAATKDHWRKPSKAEWICDILSETRKYANLFPHITIGMPPPGAGLGGLDPRWVLNEAQAFLGGCANVYYHLPE